MRNRIRLHRFLSQQELASTGLPTKLQTPSKLLVMELLKLSVILSCLYAREWVGYGSSNLWVTKPVGVSRGTGIVIHRERDKIHDAVRQSAKLVQKYI